METILGIDLGTTNSVVSIIQDGKTVVLRDDHGEAILPSVVGFDNDGRLLVGRTARNQAILAPERTVKSIKRQMGEATRVTLGEQSFTPQEISAMILRTLKDRAEKYLGRPAPKAVITVPAFFSETQREATREAGELAGLEVVRIINEPTAAALTYESTHDQGETLLVYDLGGGTFDVSIVRVEQGVVEVLASHGDTHLGGDDFDLLLLNHVCDKFQDGHGVDLRSIPVARSRMLQSVEEAKKRLSFEAYTSVSEEFIAEKDGLPLNLNYEIDRREYEQLIDALLHKTLKSVDAALEGAKLTVNQIDKIILVGGSTRTPMVHQLLEHQLGQRPHCEVDPDLCVSLGAAVQGGLIAGVDVGPVLVDITPHTLGIQCIGPLHGRISEKMFSAVIPRNTPLPASRSEIYYTGVPGQEAAEIHVLQGEDEDVTYNDSVGKFHLAGLNEQAGQGNEILVRFDLNLDGILKVTAVERATGLQKSLTVDNAITRFKSTNREEARARLASMFAPGPEGAEMPVRMSDMLDEAEATAPVGDDLRQQVAAAADLIAQATKVAFDAPAEDAREIKELIGKLETAIANKSLDRLQELCQQLDDLVFYLQDA